MVDAYVIQQNSNILIKQNKNLDIKYSFKSICYNNFEK